MNPDIPDAAFLALELPSYLFTGTCPEVEDEFRGIRIAAPKKLRAGSTLRVPVSAVARFAEESASLPKPLWDSVSAVVVDVESNRCWVGTLQNPYESPEEMPEDEEDGAAAAGGAPPSADDDIPEIEAGGVGSECAHLDLRELLDLPPTPASYEIHLTYGPWSSNSVRVVVERPKDE